MIKRAVRNLANNRRIFDVVINDETVNLEIKTGNNKYELVPWNDIVYQVETAKNQKMKV